MLNWISAEGPSVPAYHQTRGQVGEQIVFDPVEIDLARLFIEVTLSADVPVDWAARIEVAAISVRELGYSRSRSLEFIGETNPALILAEHRQEDQQTSYYAAQK
jgi:hypothetical protein